MALVIVQMGHCFRRKTATGTPGEQLFAKRTGDACGRVLPDRGHQVRVIRADDPAGAYLGDVFLAVHCDGSTDTTAHGAGVGYQSTSGRAVARAFTTAYAARGWRGFRPDNATPALKGYYGVTIARSQGVPFAFVLQAGFLTNGHDREVLTSEEGPRLVADALADAVDEVVESRFVRGRGAGGTRD
ncbi:MAG: N-acetylmuramoyl-L-alanine amidase [Actinomycetes bacterium]